ncbi:MAG: recombination mediator RecR [Bacilli bacterium]
MEQIDVVRDLIECYKKLPGIGAKTAERLAYATLDLTPEEREAFISAFLDCNTKVKKCPNCGLFYTDVCPVCSDKTRNHLVLLVVSNSKDIYSIERTKNYQGTYFTLSGTLSPLRNRTPDLIGIPRLKARVEKEGIKEIILALPTDLEGETTSLYIANIYKNNPEIKVSRLAYGLPVGTNLEYLDNLTISQSLKGRVVLNNGDNDNESK